MKHGVIHYCVTNMPGAFPKTATIALNEATLPYVLKLANDGVQALRADPGFAKGLNTYEGFITCRPVAEGFDMMTRFREFADMG
jgi:alanine dehydrogenase